MKPEVQAWKAALDAYRYPVDFREYRFQAEHEGWFEQSITQGGRDETIAFEERFRRHAPCALEAWFEVIFWKLASQPRFRDRATHRIAKRLTDTTTASELWCKCGEYTYCVSSSEAKGRFTKFFDLFGLATGSIATIATFPAFMDPDRFPMVDTRIAKWVGAGMHEHNRIDCYIQLVRPKFLDSSSTVLKMNDFDFITSWIEWCRHTARKLTNRTEGFRWRVRDVEMAVFRAWGGKDAKKHPEIDLPPIPPM